LNSELDEAINKLALNVYENELIDLKEIIK
jgi:hypothetical protein